MEEMVAYQGGAGALTSYALPIEDIKAQVNLIQHVMRDVMKDGEHFGTIPGCGDKKVLFKSGSEKIMMTFRLANDTEIEVIEMGNGHREYRIKCTLFSPDGQKLGTGVGSCSTMEGKYRFRQGGYTCPACGVSDTIIKGKPEYGAGWVCFKKKGGCGATFKDGDKSIEAQIVGKVEYDNPADYYNTWLKMAKERALVDATLTTTAASDIFTQDIEDNPELFRRGPVPVAEAQHEEARAEKRPEANKAASKKGCICADIINGAPDPIFNPDCPIHSAMQKQPKPEAKSVAELRKEDPTPEQESEFKTLAQSAKTLLTLSEKEGMNAEYRAGYTATGIALAIKFLKAVIDTRSNQVAA